MVKRLSRKINENALNNNLELKHIFIHIIEIKYLVHKDIHSFRNITMVQVV